MLHKLAWFLVSFIVMVSLAVGTASILSGIPGMRELMAYLYNFALMFEALMYA